MDALIENFRSVIVQIVQLINAYEEIVLSEHEFDRQYHDDLLALIAIQDEALICIRESLNGSGRNRIIWRQPELNNPTKDLWEESVPHYSETRFKKKFRLCRKTFYKVCQELAPILEKKNTNFRKAIPLEKRVAVALYFLKSNCTASNVADVFKIGESTVLALVHQFCDAVNNVLFDKYVVFPESIEEKKELADDFMLRWNFPNTFGALDGTHVPIKAPSHFPEDYFNYKCFHSIVLMALVDASGKFIYTNIGRPGRANDAMIFNDCALKEVLLQSSAQHPNMHIVGDGAFPLMHSLMKPYIISDRLSPEQRHYNRRLSRARVVVEDAFGRLKGRFKIIMRRGDLGVENMSKIIKTCVVLHNLCQENQDKYWKCWEDEVKEHNKRYLQPTHTVNPIFDITVAKGKRDHLCQQIFDDDFKFEDE